MGIRLSAEMWTMLQGMAKAAALTAGWRPAADLDDLVQDLIVYGAELLLRRDLDCYSEPRSYIFGCLRLRARHWRVDGRRRPTAALGREPVARVDRASVWQDLAKLWAWAKRLLTDVELRAFAAYMCGVLDRGYTMGAITDAASKLGMPRATVKRAVRRMRSAAAGRLQRGNRHLPFLVALSRMDDVGTLLRRAGLRPSAAELRIMESVGAAIRETGAVEGTQRRAAAGLQLSVARVADVIGNTSRALAVA